MRYLKIHTETKLCRDGSCLATPLICEAAHRYDKNRTEKSLKRLQCQLIVGAADSGKTRWLSRLHERWQDIWGAKHKAEAGEPFAAQPENHRGAPVAAAILFAERGQLRRHDVCDVVDDRPERWDRLVGSRAGAGRD